MASSIGLDSTCIVQAQKRIFSNNSEFAFTTIHRVTSYFDLHFLTDRIDFSNFNFRSLASYFSISSCETSSMRPRPDARFPALI